MSDIQKGHQITSAFLYVRQVFKECQRLIFKIDNQLAPEWGNLYGNRITKDNFQSEECKHIKEAYVFSLPLISITDDEAIMEKIIKPLKEL